MTGERRALHSNIVDDGKIIYKIRACKTVVVVVIVALYTVYII